MTGVREAANVRGAEGTRLFLRQVGPGFTCRPA